MAKIAAADIIGPSGFGFTKEMLQVALDADFVTLVEAIIAEQSALLSGRIGAAVYATVTEPSASRMKRAEKCFTAAEILDRRINSRLVGVQAAGEEFVVVSERQQRNDYRAEAEGIIFQLSAGETDDGVTASDFSSGVLITSHFEETDA